MAHLQKDTETVTGQETGFEACPHCGGDASRNSFDRSICACGAMHTYHDDCGLPLDDCEYTELEGTLADGLD
jgi:hypothetical protein